MDKIKVYQDVLNEGHYKLLSDNLETINEDDLLSFEEGIPGFEDLSDFIIAPIKNYEPFLDIDCQRYKKVILETIKEKL